MDTDKYIRSIPKIELHVHLEGSIPLDAFLELLKKYSSQGSFDTIDKLKEKFIFRDFSGFAENWFWLNSNIREYEDLEFIAEKAAKSFIEQNIIYSEMFFSPQMQISNGLKPQRIVESIRKGLEKCEDRISVNLICDFVKDHGPETAEIMIHEINEVKDLGVIGIGTGGTEKGNPPEKFKNLYRLARDFGFMTNVHSGENTGPENIYESLKHLEPDRIGHGCMAYKDTKMIEHLKNRKIPLEMCPGSNIKTGVFDDLAEHPIADFLKKGLLVTVNTDDPVLFNTTLTDEYLNLAKVFGLDKKEIKRLFLNAIDSAWCDEDIKKRLYNLFSD